VEQFHAHQCGLVQEQKGIAGSASERAARACDDGIVSAAGHAFRRAFVFPTFSGTARMEIRIDLPGVKLGTVEADDVRVVLVETELARLMERVCEQKRREFSVESLPNAEAIRSVRGMFREWGMDPSKYRPSSEALLRRVVQGKGLYRVSNIVDIGNLGSIETGWPYGCYDRSRIRSPIVFRHGAAGERYERVGREMWHLEGRPVLADADGPFGSPVSDSTRSMITESTREALIVIYAPASASDAGLELTTAKVGERLTLFANTASVRSGIFR
jgi:DNA/RNA-binding domain of Phe-tRNA-synthetase-like protein